VKKGLFDMSGTGNVVLSGGRAGYTRGAASSSGTPLDTARIDGKSRMSFILDGLRTRGTSAATSPLVVYGGFLRVRERTSEVRVMKGRDQGATLWISH